MSQDRSVRRRQTGSRPLLAALANGWSIVVMGPIGGARGCHNALYPDVLATRCVMLDGPEPRQNLHHHKEYRFGLWASTNGSNSDGIAGWLTSIGHLQVMCDLAIGIKTDDVSDKVHGESKVTVTLAQEAHVVVETHLNRMPHLGTWFIGLPSHPMHL